MILFAEISDNNLDRVGLSMTSIFVCFTPTFYNFSAFKTLFFNPLKIMLVSNLPELGILVRNVAHGTLFFFNFHHFGIIFQRIQGISVEILEPFLKFVFVEPLESPQYQPMKVCLQRELLALASQSDSIMLRKITGFLANILPCLQVSINNFAPVLYSFTFLIDLIKMYRCLVL